MRMLPIDTLRMAGPIVGSPSSWVTIWSRGRSIGERAHMDHPDGSVQGGANARGESKVSTAYLGGRYDLWLCELQTASRMAWQVQKKRTARSVDG